MLSGLATGDSWICYFRALKIGQAAQVAPIDKLSVVLVAIFGVVPGRAAYRAELARRSADCGRGSAGGVPLKPVAPRKAGGALVPIMRASSRQGDETQ